MGRTTGEMARQVGAVLEGDGALDIKGIAGLKEAQPGDLTFLANPRYAKLVSETRATAVLLPMDWQKPCGAPVRLRVKDPDRAFAQLAVFFAPPPVPIAPGVHPTAVVAADARLGEGVSVGPCAVIQPGAEIGEGTILHAGCYIGHGVKIGRQGLLYPHVSIREYCRIGDRVILHNGVVIGSDGFGYTVDEKGVRTKIPQQGIVVIGNDVEIGANTAVDRARFGQTRIGNGVKIDNLVQVAHNVVIGDHSVVVGQVGIAGSTEIGRYVILGGQVGLVGHVHVGDGVMVGAQSCVMKDVPPRTMVSGYPAMPHNESKKLHAHLARLPELKAKVAELEARLKALESRPG